MFWMNDIDKLLYHLANLFVLTGANSFALLSFFARTLCFNCGKDSAGDFGRLVVGTLTVSGIISAISAATPA